MFGNHTEAGRLWILVDVSRIQSFEAATYFVGLEHLENGRGNRGKTREPPFALGLKKSFEEMQERLSP